ncbi:MAG: DUF2851 family protein [Bacteroidales bacterium]|nr:DUF2851 family protein [Bacteroidales bacterium]
MTEAFLHYLWQNKMLPDRLATTDGQPVEVVHTGTLNSDAGPDFFNSRIRVGGVEWVGNVEIHIHSSDWNNHGHHHDEAYNNVVLHVVYEHDNDVRTQSGKPMPTLELKGLLHPSLVSNYESLVAPASLDAIACARRVGDVPEFKLSSFMERLLVERIEAKAATVRRLLEESRGGWEQTCYWLMAHYFGGKVNSLPFEMLAKSLDQHLLARWSDNRERVEALLMGQAGLLDGYFEDEYARNLQADYEALATAAALHPIGGYLWKFYKLRPSSFPTVRISQFADLMSRSKNLFATLLSLDKTEDIVEIFQCSASDYWNTHYRFDQPSEHSASKRLGTQQSMSLVINAWVPLLFVYGVEHSSQEYKDRALALLQQLPVENNVVVRMWTGIGVRPKNAADSQSLLQLHNNYCTNKRCLECRIGYHILKH